MQIPHLEEPDYNKNRSPLKIQSEAQERLFERLCFLYDETEARKCILELERILKVYYAYKPQEMIEAEKHFDPANRFTEKDMILITYGDLLRSKERSPLATLAHFLESPLAQGFKDVNTLHILPFFPYSSDRGFSIIDFRNVDPKLGSWQDIEEIGKRYQLMFDAVCNHTSCKSIAFQEMLNDNPDYQDIAIIYRAPNELTPEQRQKIFRPRTSDILTEYQSINGEIWVWTTFSKDQIDLNYKNPKVLLWIIETLLLYVRHGADIIRLDAVTYLWKEPGTSCANLEQTHQIIKLFRDVLNVVAPGVALITETNVPHEQNISYFGNGRDEAQMVYNFALPPLVLYTFYKADATVLSHWVQHLKYPSQTTTFLNILDTHDGIGLMGVKDILSPEEIDFMIMKAKEHGAFVSYRTGKDGSEEPYEINTTWFSALNLDHSDEGIDLQVKRFVASRSIALVLRGVPGTYFHGLIGTVNDIDVVLETKSKGESNWKREINRQVLEEEALLEELKDPNSKLSEIEKRLGKLRKIRVRQPAFHPNGKQRVLTITEKVFALLRLSPGGEECILTLTNVTSQKCEVEIPFSELGVESTPSTSEPHWHDLIGGKEWSVQQQKLRVTMQPYDVVWLINFC
jgi:sucrose phosphorylase